MKEENTYMILVTQQPERDSQIVKSIKKRLENKKGSANIRIFENIIPFLCLSIENFILSII